MVRAPLGWLGALLLASTLWGCSCGSTGADGRTYACADDADCADGFKCVQQLCRPEGTITPAALAFVGTPATLQAGSCSGAIAVEARDGSNLPVALSSSAGVALSGAPSNRFAFYSDAACTTVVTGLTIAQGATSATVYLRGEVAGAMTISASSNGLTAASQPLTLVPGPASTLAFKTAPVTTSAGSCSPPITVESRDAVGNPSNVAAVVDLALVSTASGGFSFYADAGCTTPITTVPLRAGTGEATFFFSTPLSATFDVSASAPTLLAATQAATVLPAPASRLEFTSQPQSLAAGACSQPAVIRVRDDYGNAVPQLGGLGVALTAASDPGAQFFSDAACSQTISTLAIPAGESTGTFYFSLARSGGVDVTASALGLVAAVQTETVGAGIAEAVAFGSAAQTVGAGSCSQAVAIRAVDNVGNPAPVGAAITVSLSASPSTSFGFFADNFCTVALTQVSIPGGGSSASFYFRGRSAGPVVITANTSSFGAATQTETINPGPASSVSIISPAQSVGAGDCSATVLVEAHDLFGNPAPIAAGATFNLSANPASGVTFYGAAACAGSPGTTARVPPGGTTAPFSFKATTLGTLTVTVQAGTLGAPAQDETITAAAPSTLNFLGGAQTVTAGVCSSAATLELRDVFGNVSPSQSGTPVALAVSPSSGFTFFADASCVTAASSVTVPSGSSSVGFYFKSTVSGPVTVTATSPGLTTASQAETISAAAPAALGFLTGAQTLAVDTCSTANTVQTTDAFGNIAPVNSATAVNLAASPATSFTFYSDAACATAVTSVSIAANASQGTYYFKGTRSGTVNVTASAASMSSASQAEVLNPAAASALVYTSGAQSISAGSCSALVTLQSRDAFGNTSSVPAGATVALSANPSSGLLFYDSSSCTNAITQAAIAPGSSGATFYFRSTVTGAFTLTSSASGLGSVNQGATIGPAAASALVLTTSAQSLLAGQCSTAATVQIRDSLGNAAPAGTATAVNLAVSPSSGFTLFSNSGCTTAVTQVTVASGSSTASFFFKSTATGSFDVTASVAGLTPATQTEAISPAAPSVLEITSPAQTVSAGQCSSAVALQTVDAFGNPSNAQVATTVTLTAAPSSGFAFYSDSGCTAAASTATIASGSNTASLYFKGTAAGRVTLTAAATGYSNATQAATVRSATASSIAFVSPTQSVSAGGCSKAATVQVRDAFGNVATVTAATNVALSSNGGGAFQFFSDAGCATGVTSVSIPANGNGASFYFRSTSAAAVTLTAASLSTVTQPATIVGAAPVTLGFAGAAQSVAAGACSGSATVRLSDVYANPTTTPAALTVSLSAAPSSGFAFYSDSGCTTAITSVPISAGAGSANLFFKGTVAGNVRVTAAASPIGTAQQLETIRPATPSALAFTTPPQSLYSGFCSEITTVAARDQFGNAAPVGTATAVNLSGLSFSSDAACTTAVTSVTIGATASEASFYFSSATTGSPVATAAASGLTSAAQTETISAPQNRVGFASAPPVLPLGGCSGLIQAQLQDAAGNPITVGTTTTVNVSVPAGLVLYTKALCSGGPTSTSVNVTISAGSSTSTAALYLRVPSTVGTYPMTAAATGWASTVQDVTVQPGAPASLLFVTTAQSLLAGDCSATATVQARDGSGNVAPVAAATTINLTASPATGFTFYSDAGCATPTTGVTMAAGTSTASFWFRATRSGAVTLTAQAPFASTTQAENILAGAPASLAFTSSAQNLMAQACSAQATLAFRDQFGNTAPVTTATQVALSSAPAGGVQFFSDAGCTVAIGNLTFASGASSGGFYFRPLSGGAVTLVASPSYLGAATQTENVTSTVRSGSCTLAAGATTVSCPISPAQVDLSKTFLLFQATAGADDTASSSNVTCWLASTSAISCHRLGTNLAASIGWQTVELPTGLSVRHLKPTCSGGSSINVPISPVASMADTFTLYSGANLGTIQFDDDFATVQLTSTSNVAITWSAACDTANYDGSLQVVELSGASVTRGTAVINAGAVGAAPGALSSADPARTLLLYSWRVGGVQGPGICDKSLRGENDSATSLVFFRGDESTNAACTAGRVDVAWERIDLGAGRSVQRPAAALAAGALSGAFPLATAVDPTRSVVLAGGQSPSGQGGGEGTYATNDVLGEVVGRMTLTNPNTVTVTRGNAAGASAWTPYVVQF